ncbi:MAG: hypothetical protein VX941_10600 [Pseudomonadota bacterium]|nr:hypothetical protein [Pseudomonadota bacterium]
MPRLIPWQLYNERPFVLRTGSRIIAIFGLLIFLASCQSSHTDPTQKTKSLASTGMFGIVAATNGYSVGGAAGAAGLGLAGLSAGFLVANYAEQQDSKHIDLALNKILSGPVGQIVTWINPYNTNAGKLTLMSPEVDTLNGRCQWVRSEYTSKTYRYTTYQDYTKERKNRTHEDLILCDEGEGWYITWDEDIATRLKSLTPQTK